MKLVCPIIVKDDMRLLGYMKDSRRIYDQSLYHMRQAYFSSREQGKIKTYTYGQLYDIVKDSLAFKESDLDYVAKQYSIRQVFNSWKSFIKASMEYKRNPGKFTGRPQIVRYLYRRSDYNVLSFDHTRFSRIGCRPDEIMIPKTGFKVKIPNYIDTKSVKQLRVIKFYDRIKIEIVYEVPDKEIRPLNSSSLGIDIGLDNLCAVTSNDKGLSYVINGRPLKSMNQYFNKKRGELQGKNNVKGLKILSRKHYNKMNNYLHWCSRQAVNLCKVHGIDNIVICHNDGWKQKINLGRRVNQNFVSIPFNRLIEQIRYKAGLEGINVIVTEESYTSKTDHLAFEPMERQETYLGKRIKRGLFQSSTGKLLNADINGAIGILRKTNAILDEELLLLQDRGDVVSPRRLEKAS